MNTFRAFEDGFAGNFNGNSLYLGCVFIKYVYLKFLLNVLYINIRPGLQPKPIQIPYWVNIVNYRTMTNEKKNLAVSGNKNMQYEWMKEEVNEFYEAIHLQNLEEIRDEAIGLIRTVQQFNQSLRVLAMWKKVKKDVASVFPTRKIFLETFSKRHEKKLSKNKQSVLFLMI